MVSLKLYVYYNSNINKYESHFDKLLSFHNMANLAFLEPQFPPFCPFVPCRTTLLSCAPLFIHWHTLLTCACLPSICLCPFVYCACFPFIHVCLLLTHSQYIPSCTHEVAHNLLPTILKFSQPLFAFHSLLFEPWMTI